MPNSFEVLQPTALSTVNSANGLVDASGTYDAQSGNLKVIHAKVIRSSDPLPSAPWDIDVDTLRVNLGGASTWSFPGVTGAMAGPNNRLVAWGCFANDITPRPDANSPEFTLNITNGSGSGFEVARLVSMACGERGGVPALLHLTIEKCTHEPLCGQTAKLHWNGEHWRGLMRTPEGVFLTWQLKSKGCKECEPRDFELIFEDRPAKNPTSVCCEPFELRFNEKKSIKLGRRGAKFCPPNTTAEITVCE